MRVECRVRRKRKRVPSSLLIENVSAQNASASPERCAAETFPIRLATLRAQFLKLASSHASEYTASDSV